MDKMVTIAVIGLKGGVGKTTTATNIAYLLAKEQDKRVLVMDADCQGNASSVFNAYDPEGIGMAQLMESVLEQKEVVLSDYIKKTGYGIDIIPANGYLMQTNGRLLVDSENDQIHILSDALQQCNGVYDYCIIDCGLQMDITVANAALAADLIINPLRLGGFEMSALDNLLTQTEDLRQLKKDIKVKSLITMFQNNKFSRGLEEWLQGQKRFDFFATHIRNSVVVAKNSLSDGPVTYHSKNSNASKDYRALVAELLQDWR